MVNVTYKIVEHDGGWAYKVGDVFSEPFPTHNAALRAAEAAAQEQQVGGNDEIISYQDEAGNWVEETASGGDRPETTIEDQS